MLFLFNTPSDAVTITASPAADGKQSLGPAADMQKPKQNIAQLALTLTLVRLAGDGAYGQSSLQDSTTAYKHTVGSSQLNYHGT